jgi:hypothetical protein
LRTHNETVPTPDPALEALERVLAAVDEVEKDFAALRVRAEHIKTERARGTGYRDLVPAEERPLVVQLLASIQEKLSAAGAEWRREEARALHSEGVSMEAIAGLFGVTRQRVGALLSSRDDTGRRGRDRSDD